MNDFSEPGSQMEKDVTVIPSESLLSSLLPPNDWTEEFAATYLSELSDEPSSEDSSFFLPCKEWEEKLAATHPGDLSAIRRAELDEHLQSCSACRAVRAHDRIIDDLICTSFFGPATFPEQASEPPPLLLKIWEFQSMQENLALQKSKNTYTQYQPDEQVEVASLASSDHSVGKTAVPSMQVAHVLVARIGADIVLNQLSLFFSVLTGILFSLTIYSIVPIIHFANFTAGLIEHLKFFTLPPMIGYIVICVAMHCLRQPQKGKLNHGDSPGRRRHQRHQGAELPCRPSKQAVSR